MFIFRASWGGEGQRKQAKSTKGVLKQIRNASFSFSSLKTNSFIHYFPFYLMFQSKGTHLQDKHLWNAM